MSQKTPEAGSLGVLRAAALIAVPVGAVGSVGLMLYAGRHNPSRILLLLFAIWVLSPFVAAALASLVSNRWSVITRATLYVVMLALTLGSLAIYGGVAFGYVKAKIGFVFLVVPLASWLLLGLALAMAALVSGRRVPGRVPTPFDVDRRSEISDPPLVVVLVVGSGRCRT